MSDRPTTALEDCDDPTSKLQVQLKAIQRALEFCLDNIKRFNDVMWPIIEDMPPGALRDMTESKWERKTHKPKDKADLAKTIEAHEAKGWVVEIESMEAPGGELTMVVFKRRRNDTP